MNDLADKLRRNAIMSRAGSMRGRLDTLPPSARRLIEVDIPHLIKRLEAAEKVCENAHTLIAQGFEEVAHYVSASILLDSLVEWESSKFIL